MSRVQSYSHLKANVVEEVVGGEIYWPVDYHADHRNPEHVPVFNIVRLEEKTNKEAISQERQGSCCHTIITELEIGVRLYHEIKLLTTAQKYINS